MNIVNTIELNVNYFLSIKDLYGNTAVLPYGNCNDLRNIIDWPENSCWFGAVIPTEIDVDVWGIFTWPGYGNRLDRNYAKMFLEEGKEKLPNARHIILFDMSREGQGKPIMGTVKPIG